MYESKYTEIPGLKLCNAEIDSVKLGYDEDEGYLTAKLLCRLSTITFQKFGGDNFGSESSYNDVHSEALSKFIRGVLTVAGVDSWEKLKGQYIRVRCDKVKIYEIGNIIEEVWFS